MSLIRNLVCLMVALAIVGGASEARAHMAFKKAMQKKYAGMKVSCNACHVKGKPKTDRSDFGKLFYKEIQKTHPSLTKDWKAKKGSDKKNFEKKTMVPAFHDALKIVKALKNDKGEVYDDLIKNGKISDIKKDPKYKPTSGTNAAGSSSGAAKGK